MKSKQIIFLVAVVALIAIVFYSFQGSDDLDYLAQLERERKDTDRFMKTSSESPIPDKQNFTGLKYFPPDQKYRVLADLEPVTNKKTITLGNSDGLEQRYTEYAYAVFSIDGTENRLLILESIDPGVKRGTLFLAFADKTSANETYGAGRYLDVTKTPGASTITLDFNKAYNPYCAYNDTYSCPFPPPENLLKIPILAGEKNYH